MLNTQNKFIAIPNYNKKWHRNIEKKKKPTSTYIEYHTIRKDVHLCFITSPGKITKTKSDQIRYSNTKYVDCGEVCFNTSASWSNLMRCKNLQRRLRVLMHDILAVANLLVQYVWLGLPAFKQLKSPWRALKVINNGVFWVSLYLPYRDTELQTINFKPPIQPSRVQPRNVQAPLVIHM